MTSPISVETTVKAPMSKVWDCWVDPKHITQWTFASDDWEAPSAENDLRVGGTFKTVMAAKDKSYSFDFGGTYTDVTHHARIEYDMDDARHVAIVFQETPDGVSVIETFDPENSHSRQVQQDGWQAILDNFKKYVESST